VSDNLAEQLTTNFYLWEERGRGWQLWNFPVELEPPFIPFFHSYRNTQVIDDGRKPTFFSTLADSIKSAINKTSDEDSTLLVSEEREETLPNVFSDESEIKELAISLPNSTEVPSEYIEHLFLSLSICRLPVSFEILGTNEEIIIQFVCREPDYSYVNQQIRSFFPGVIIREGKNLSHHLGIENRHSLIVDCGLNQEFMRPLRTFKNFNPDPLTTIFSSMENLREGEIGLVQVLFQAVNAPWSSNIMRAVRNDDGSCFFIDAPEMLKFAEEKVRRPIYSVVLRLMGQSSSDERTKEIVRNLFGGLQVFSNPLSNELIPLTNTDYKDDLHLEDVLRRQSHRSGMLLNSDELLGLVHFPSPTLHSSKLKRESRKTQPVPVIATGHSFVIGNNVHHNVSKEASLSIEQRIRHIHIIGKTGTGKSTLLVNMIRQDIEAGRGVTVLDPHGDLIDRIVERIPENRVKDVILFDPSDTEYPVGFNILEAHSEIEQRVLSSDLVDIFRRFSSTWGDQMTTVLSNAIDAFLESSDGGTLIELKRFLLEQGYRDSILSQCVDPHIVYFWKKEYPLLRGASQVSIITRLDAFLRSKMIRNILTQRQGLNFTEIIETGKIFLAKLSQGIIGEENAYLLGSLICSKLHQVVMGRQALNISKRKPFFLYLDEFQHFAVPSMASMLSGSRKMSFGLTLSHQDLQQIFDSGLANSVITNPATRICFSLGDNDAQKLQSGFAHFDASDLMNLGVGEAIARIERNESDFNLTTFDLTIVSQEIASLRRDQIVAHSREMYGRKLPSIETPIPQVEKIIVPAILDKIKPEATIQIEKKEEPKPRPIIDQPDVSIPTEALEKRQNISQHRYLQTLIKKMAEQRGYKAVIEEPTPDGGRVDVGLEREGKRIAVEISVTTGDTQELHNIEKCIRAGFDPVIVCSPEKKNLDTIRKLTLEKLTTEDQHKVRFFESTEISTFLDEQTIREVNTESRVKGYRVKVNYEAITNAEKNQKQEAIAQVIGQSLRRLKKDS
jgi:hypothetical protein